MPAPEGARGGGAPKAPVIHRILAVDDDPLILDAYRRQFAGPDYDLSIAADGSIDGGTSSFLAGPPRVAALWHDLDPTLGGKITFDQTPGIRRSIPSRSWW